jgi:hypothetical protein
MAMRFLVAILLVGSAHAQEDPGHLLRQVRDKIADTLNRLPRYMCTQTIERRMYEPRHLERHACDDASLQRSTRLTSSDRLRLDVATGGGSQSEIYTWVGEGHFDNRDLVDIVHEGAISNGSFTAVLRSVFRSEEVRFTYDGDTVEGGRTLAEFGFKVPYDQSHYQYRKGRGNGWVVTGYSGTFLADPKTAALVRLVLKTDRLPEETGDCFATTSLDYAPVNMNGFDFLLPSASVLRIVGADGGVSENHAAFSSCHEFLGESTLKFDAPADRAASPSHREVASDTRAIPAGIRFRLALLQAINPKTAAVGDPVKARLLTPIGPASNPLAVRGAAVLARIVRLRQFYGHSPSVSLGLKLETADVHGVPTPLHAELDRGHPFLKSKNGSLHARVELGTLAGLDTLEFHRVKSDFVIPAGNETEWVTTSD